MTEDLKNDIKQELESWNELKDKILNIIPVKEISFRTRALLSDILDRLELSKEDRRDLEKYIIYGGGENIEYIKSTIGDLLNKVPELNFLIENIQTIIPLLNKLEDILKSSSPFDKGSGENSAILKNANNKADGNFSTSIGTETHAIGEASFAEGKYTETKNTAEHAEGQYNVSNSNTIHSVGIGTSDNDRKNAHEITKEGKHYIFGIGGYDGTNAVDANEQGIIAKPIQEIVSENNQLNLSLDTSMSKEKCLEIYNKLNELSQNKFYTINIYDIPTKEYYGNPTVLKLSTSCRIYCSYVDTYKQLYTCEYTFRNTGTYSRVNMMASNIGTLEARISTIINQLNEITTNG